MHLTAPTSCCIVWSEPCLGGRGRGLETDGHCGGRLFITLMIEIWTKIVLMELGLNFNFHNCLEIQYNLCSEFLKSSYLESKLFSYN